MMLMTDDDNSLIQNSPTCNSHPSWGVLAGLALASARNYGLAPPPGPPCIAHHLRHRVGANGHQGKTRQCLTPPLFALPCLSGVKGLTSMTPLHWNVESYNQLV